MLYLPQLKKMSQYEDVKKIDDINFFDINVEFEGIKDKSKLGHIDVYEKESFKISGNVIKSILKNQLGFNLIKNNYEFGLALNSFFMFTESLLRNNHNIMLSYPIHMDEITLFTQDVIDFIEKGSIKDFYLKDSAGFTYGNSLVQMRKEYKEHKKNFKKNIKTLSGDLRVTKKQEKDLNYGFMVGFILNNDDFILARYITDDEYKSVKNKISAFSILNDYEYRDLIISRSEFSSFFPTNSSYTSNPIWRIKKDYNLDADFEKEKLPIYTFKLSCNEHELNESFFNLFGISGNFSKIKQDYLLEDDFSKFSLEVFKAEYDKRQIEHDVLTCQNQKKMTKHRI